MPRISAFYAIVIRVYSSDHEPPHVHAAYAGTVALLAIANSAVIDGWLPPAALRLVEEWAQARREELLANWERAQRREPVVPVEPLA